MAQNKFIQVDIQVIQVHRSVPVTNQSVGHHQGDVVRDGPAAALDGSVVPHPDVAPGVSAGGSLRESRCRS